MSLAASVYPTVCTCMTPAHPDEVCLDCVDSFEDEFLPAFTGIYGSRDILPAVEPTLDQCIYGHGIAWA